MKEVMRFLWTLLPSRNYSVWDRVEWPKRPLRSGQFPRGLRALFPVRRERFAGPSTPRSLTLKQPGDSMHTYLFPKMNDNLIRRIVSKFWIHAMLVAATVVGTAGTVIAQNCTPAPDGLVGWWPAERHSYDIIGKRSAVIQGAVGYTNGVVGQAFQFNGSGGRVRILENTNTDLSRLSRWTIEGWVRPESFSNSTYPTIFTEGNRIATLGIQSGTGRLESWVNNDSSRRLFSTNSLTLGGSNHVALVFDGTRRLLYLNGKLDGATNSPAITDDGSGASLGQSTINDSTTVFQGSIDDWSIYNVALTATQISSIHGAGAGGKCFGNSPAPTFVIESTGRDAFLGETITLTALAAGAPKITYQWLFNGNPVTAPNVSGADTYSLTVSNVTFANGGGYSLRANNPFGSATSAVAQISVPWCTEPPTDIIAWWPADGSGLDSITNHHDGAVWGGTTYGPGVAGAAFRFNGTDAYVAVIDAPELSPHVGTNGEMTVEAWVKLDQLPQTDAVTGQARRTVFAKGSPGQWEYGISLTTAGVPEFYLWTPAGTTVAGVTGGQILTGRWHHIVATLKKGDALNLYQNGQLVGTSTNFTGASGDGNSPLYIGRRGDAQFLKGWVDEAALYDRALNAAEVTALYAAAGSGKCSGAPGPAPWFTRQPENQSGYLLLGAGLSAFANGTPRSSYQWYRSNATEWAIMPGQTNGSLVFTNLSKDVEGNYRVVAINPHNSTTSQSAYIFVVCHDILCGGEHFEKGWNGWETDGSIWQIGTRTGQTNGLAATVLDGNYPGDADSRLISPAVQLPSVVAGEELELRFWQWASYSWRDYGYVQVSVWTNGTWSAWVTVAQPVDEAHETPWSKVAVGLRAYAGRQVRLSFYHVANPYYGDWSDVGSGWYLDDIEIWRGVPQWTGVEGFENGWRDWSTDGGIWQVGVPTSGPNQAHGGQKVAATVVGGSYPAWPDSRLISPAVQLPSVVAGEELELRFWQWASYSWRDYGYVQVSVWTNGTWSAWVTVAQPVDEAHETPWSKVAVGLRAYAGRQVRLSFYHVANPYYGDWSDVGSGWYLDDIHIKRGNISLISPAARTNSETGNLSFQVGVVGTTPDSCVSYQLIDPPKGATIDPVTGMFSWTPEECQGPATYNIGIYVVDFCNNEANDLGFVKVTVNEVNQPPRLSYAEGTVYVGKTNFITLCSDDPDCPRNPLAYSFIGNVPGGLTIDASSGVLRWAPTRAQIGTYTNRVRLCDGGSPNYCVTNTLVVSVTTNLFGLEIGQVAEGTVHFILTNASTQVSYMLQKVSDLCGCECRTAWEDDGIISPTEMPYIFERVMDRPYRFYRLKEVPRR